jgi:hypothetical protein
MREKPCIVREVIKAIAAGSATFRPDGLLPNADPIALVTPWTSVTILIRKVAVIVVRFCSRDGYSCLSDLIGTEGIAKFEIHKKKSTSKTPSRIKRTMFYSVVIELRRRLSGKISDLIFPEVTRFDSIQAYSLPVLGIEELLEVTDCGILPQATVLFSIGPGMEMMCPHWLLA